MSSEASILSFGTLELTDLITGESDGVPGPKTKQLPRETDNVSGHHSRRNSLPFPRCFSSLF